MAFAANLLLSPPASGTLSPSSDDLIRLSRSRSSFSYFFRTRRENTVIANRIRHFSRPVCSTSVEFPVTESVSSCVDHKEAELLQFVKYHGIGNDFILVDNGDSSVPKVTPDQAVKLCDRNYGIGADGVILVMPGIDGADYTMKIFNSDGSEPEMCGNGMRCFAKFIAHLKNLNGRQRFSVHTGAGLIIADIQEDGMVKVDMGEPILKPYLIPTKILANKGEFVIKATLNVDGYTWNVTCVSMGNPHCVTFGNIERQGLVVDELDLPTLGPKFEHHRVFPARTNTEFVQVFSAIHVKMRVWERGAGATLACGTGACAAVVAGVLEGHCGRICMVDLPGGSLQVEWNKSDNHVYLIGPAEVVFSGSLSYNALHSRPSIAA